MTSPVIECEPAGQLYGSLHTNKPLTHSCVSEHGIAALHGSKSHCNQLDQFPLYHALDHCADLSMIHL